MHVNVAVLKNARPHERRVAPRLRDSRFLGATSSYFANATFVATTRNTSTSRKGAVAGVVGIESGVAATPMRIATAVCLGPNALSATACNLGQVSHDKAIVWIRS
jgi:hypothetical protein